MFTVIKSLKVAIQKGGINMSKREWCKIYKCWCNEIEEHTKNKYVCNMECLICEDCIKKEETKQGE